MPRLGLLLVLLMIWPASGFAQRPPIEFQIMESDPGFTSSLARGEGLFVRLTYRSNRPVRFRMQGYARGAEVKDGAMYNGAPPYPAGEGEALVWLAYRQAMHIDEIRITATPAADNSPMSSWTSALAPTSMPRVGSSSTSTDGLTSSHLASITFCWFPPERLATGVDSDGVRIPRRWR